jgi:glycosyltransferase involved in cell wall biosynthesis
MNTSTYISVVAPVYNEAGAIKTFLTRTEAVLIQLNKSYEIIIVDDGSLDNSVDLVKEYAQQSGKVRLISLSRNYGHEIALTAGIEHTRGEFVVQMDSDLQHPPELIPELVHKINEGFDVVYAARTERRHQSALKKITSTAFYRLARKMTGFDLPDNATNFRIITRQVVKSLMRLTENNRHMLMLYAYLGFNMSSIPFVSGKRLGGASKYNYRKLCNLAIDSIISFSHRPLRYMSILSVVISLLLSFYAGFILLQKLLSTENLPNGITSVIFITSGLFAILFLFLAIISEYIGRILVESKNRPLYNIKEYYDYKSDS